MKRSKTVTCGTAGMNKMECSMDGGCCCCEGMGMMEKGHMRQGSERMKTESTTDTIDGKIIKKQIEIINK